MTADELRTGAQIGRYVIVERVGTGAMGVVYGAYDPQLDRKIALKLIKPGQGVKDTARARLLREAKAIARLQHPNVVAVHDVGVIDDQVFLAMEFVAGGTIKSWLAAQPRSWREILDVFIAAGRGLAAAHAAGLVHRDFKPDNVLLDKEQRPRVVDFGIARQAGGGDDDIDGESGDVQPDGTATLRDSSGKHALATVTKTGTWVGTPAYMAPEQFLGERGDEKSDQFSFCVALYEALYGERPFAGDDMLSISVNVTTEQLRPLPKDRGVPAWIRRVILRGLKVEPAGRWDSMAALIAALENDPAVALRRRLLGGVAAALVVATVIGAWQVVSRRRAQVDHEIGRYVDEANRSFGAARSKLGDARGLRTRAFASFDAMDKETGETLWRQARALLPGIDASYDEAEGSLEAAFMLDQTRAEHRTRLSEIRYEHFLFAEDFRIGSKTAILHERILGGADGGGRKMLNAPGVLKLSASPAATEAILERYESNALTGRRVVKPAGPLAGATTSLAPGSYRIEFSGAGLAHVIYPFEVRRGEQVVVDVSLPAVSSVPEGFAYVPPGEFWFGDADEQLRTQFLGTVPIHRRRTEGYAIARHETTYGEWIAFLDALPADERSRYTPHASAVLHGSMRLQQIGQAADPQWQLIFQPASQRYSARLGEPVNYLGRHERARQDWTRFPVAGVDPSDVTRYLAWLRSTKRVPGARLCSELEWERAARGADDRLFPHGDELRPEEANFDQTYRRVDSAFGPDAVGSYPSSRSPFDVDDMAGNVFEFVASSQLADEIVIRGGGYYFTAYTCRSTNREPVQQTFRDMTTGIRVCASIKE